MNIEYKNLEIKIFALKILKFISVLLFSIFLLCLFLFVDKTQKINAYNNLSQSIKSLILENKELLFNIERPTIYTDFDSINYQTEDINSKTRSIIKQAIYFDLLDSSKEAIFINSLNTLGGYIVDFNSILANSASQYKSFNILYDSDIKSSYKKDILELVFNNKVQSYEIKNIQNRLKQLILSIEGKKSELKNKIAQQKDNVKSIKSLNEELENQEELFSFFSQGYNLLQSLLDLRKQREQILKFDDINTQLQEILQKTQTKISTLHNDKNEISVNAAIVLMLFALCILFLYRYSWQISNLVRVLYKAFIFSPIQQILVKKHNDDYNISFVNETFAYGVNVGEQSYQSRKVQANNFYDSLNTLGIFDKQDLKTFNFGSIVQESHNKIELYNENNINTNRDTKFFSVFKKEIDTDYDLINKVDVSKKIFQIKTYKDLANNLKNKLTTDELTGLLSLRALQEDSKNDLKKIFVYIKIDNFNDIRLNYSTVIVDDIIRCFVQSLKNAIFQSEFKESLGQTKFYHLQLDEFCIACETKEQAINIAYSIVWHFNKQKIKSEHIQDEIPLKQKFDLAFYNDKKVSDIELNIGISSDSDITRHSNYYNSDDYSSSFEVINRLAQAILASYETINTRAAFCIYDKDKRLGIEEKYAHQQKVENDIRYAIANNGFFVVCQGVHSIANSTYPVEYYEILVRMRDKDGNVKSPYYFLEIAKKVGYYKEIQKIVMTKAFELIEQTNACFSINMANSDIVDIETSKYFLSKLKECSKPQNLCIEILESEGIEKYDEIAYFLSEIKRFGSKIAIDDFGSGYSNFYRLLKVNFDYLKIDGSIIQGLKTDSKNADILKLIVDFAKKQNYAVVAEFVSDTEILEIVRNLQINKAQGYVLSEPKEAEEIFPYLKANFNE